MDIEPLALTSNGKIIMALFIGFLSGFALMKSDLIWKKSALDILTLKDGRLLKTVLFYIGFGSLGFYLLERYGVVRVNVLPSYIWGSIVGGVLAGIGIVIGGFTPVTALTNFVTGRVYTIWAIIGMLISIPVIKKANGFLSDTLYRWSQQVDDPIPSDSIVQFWHNERMLSTNNGALIVFVISCVLIVVVQLTLGDSSEE